MAFLRVATLGGEVKEFYVGEGTPVLDFLADKGVPTQGYRVEVNGAIADGSTTIESDATVILAPQVKGGTYK
jgi:sulfur carrier protein ThiS